jgi:hypothetical protein
MRLQVAFARHANHVVEFFGISTMMRTILGPVRPGIEIVKTALHVAILSASASDDFPHFMTRPEFAGYVRSHIRSHGDASAANPRAESRRAGRLPGTRNQTCAKCARYPPQRRGTPRPISAVYHECVRYRVLEPRPGALAVRTVIVLIFVMPGAYAHLNGSFHDVMAHAGTETLGIPASATAPFVGMVAHLPNGRTSRGTRQSLPAHHLVAVLLQTRLLHRAGGNRRN